MARSRTKRMVRGLAGAIFAMGLIVGCRGSVERLYDDAIITPIAEGGATTDTGTPTEAGPTTKEHADASSDGAAPLTAPAQISGTVLGVIGTGLVLQNSGGDDLPITADGAFAFATTVAPGQPYDVTIKAQPTGPSQTCTVANGSGKAAGKDVTDIKITCQTATFPVGGTVVGLAAGKSVTLQNNGGNDVVVNGTGTGSDSLAFSFLAVQSGNNFNVTIKTSSPGTTCAISGGTGTLGSAAVDSVVVNCGTDTYTVGGTVTGLAGTVVVTNNGGNNRTISSNGSYAFSLPISSGASYDVKVKTQPAFPPQTQVCTVSNGTGTVGAANVTNANISCVTTKFTVGGTVNGLTGAGLRLENKGTNGTDISAPGGPFTFSVPISSGTTYSVTVKTQPAGQICSVVQPSGTIGSSNVNNVVVNCGGAIVLSEKFDGVEDPDMPAGWTTETLFTGGGSNGDGETFFTVSDFGDYLSGPNSMFVENVDGDRDVALYSPPFTVTSTTAKLSFWNKYRVEDDWDGAVLEISIDGAPWADILTAGGSFSSGGYVVTLLAGENSSRLAGRPAWSGQNTVTTIVNLPAAAAGKSTKLRWRFASDDGASYHGWWIDDVVVTN